MKKEFKLHPHQVAAVEALKKLGPTMTLELPAIGYGLSLAHGNARELEKSKKRLKMILKPKKGVQ